LSGLSSTIRILGTGHPPAGKKYASERCKTVAAVRTVGRA
jgi:hypothetical protein